MIIGAMKCGTTSLSEILKMHPNISFCKIKEPHFFSSNNDWKKKLSKYHQLFQIADNKIYGEASTTYTMYPHKRHEIWNDIYEYNPNMKFIYIVRNPVDRSISNYMHMYEKGRTNLGLDEALKKNPLIMDTNKYFTQIEPYINTFGRKAVLIIDFDDFIRDKYQVIKQVIEFLNLDYSLLNEKNTYYKNSSIEGYKLNPRYDNIINCTQHIRQLMPDSLKQFLKKSLSSKDRVFKEKPRCTDFLKQQIKEKVEPELDSLGVLMGKDLSKWKTN